MFPVLTVWNRGDPTTATGWLHREYWHFILLLQLDQSILNPQPAGGVSNSKRRGRFVQSNQSLALQRTFWSKVSVSSQSALFLQTAFYVFNLSVPPFLKFTLRVRAESNELVAFSAFNRQRLRLCLTFGREWNGLAEQAKSHLSLSLMKHPTWNFSFPLRPPRLSFDLTWILWQTWNYLKSHILSRKIFILNWKGEL